MKSMTAVIIIVLAFVVLSLVQIFQKPEICFQSTCFSVEIADTPGERAQGLMYRDSLDDDKGMLFVFENSGVYSFWMKNTLIPLDMIWLDENFKVVHIETATPCVTETCISYNPMVEAKYVLEINSGMAEREGIGVGSVLKR